MTRRRRRIVRVTLVALAGLVLLGAGVAGFAYWKLDGNLRSIDLDSRLGTGRPPAASNGSFNILVLGSDSRSGANGSLAGGATEGTARSDTAMIVHIAQDHRHATIVSIPRDTLVTRPVCTTPDGRTLPAAKGQMYNSAFEIGGAACAVKTTEQLTGLRMDHYVQLDFAGFAQAIDAIGGVTVTTTVGIHDQDSGLDLPAGTHHLGGTQALAFVRTRHGVGDGSDLGRIELQKEMVRSIVSQVDGAGLLGSPVRLWTLSDSLTKSLTTDSALSSVSTLVGLADELKGIGTDRMTMVTVPVLLAPSDPNRVVEEQPDAGLLWTALRADRSVPPVVVGDQPTNPADATPGPTPATPGETPGEMPVASPVAGLPTDG